MKQQQRTLLGFDYGMKNIGVAVGQEITRSATPVTTVAATDGRPDWARITQLIATWHPDGLVVGIPLQMDDSEQEMSHAARRFARRLQGRYQLPVYEMDERLSSVEAHHLLYDDEHMGKIGRKRQAGMIDQLAAQLILTTFFNQDKPQKDNK